MFWFPYAQRENHHVRVLSCATLQCGPAKLDTLIIKRGATDLWAEDAPRAEGVF